MFNDVLPSKELTGLWMEPGGGSSAMYGAHGEACVSLQSDKRLEASRFMC